MRKILATLALLAGIARAEITYPVDAANTRWAIIDTTSGEIIKRNAAWPRSDGGAILGLPTNIVYLLHVNEAAPTYDSRVFTLNATEIVDVPQNQLRRTFTAVRRPIPEIQVAAQNREMEEIERHGIDLAREVLETRLLLTALIQYSIDGQTLPPKVSAFAVAYKDRGVKLWKNRDRVQSLLSAIEAGQDFDLDAGWEPAE